MLYLIIQNYTMNYFWIQFMESLFPVFNIHTDTRSFSLNAYGLYILLYASVLWLQKFLRLHIQNLSS